MKRGLLVPLLAIGWLLSLSIAFFAGAVTEEFRHYVKQYHSERAVLEPILKGSPEFADVRIIEQSNGGANLVGTVPNERSLNALSDAVLRALGELRSQVVMSTVHTKDRQQK